MNVIDLVACKEEGRIAFRTMGANAECHNPYDGKTQGARHLLWHHGYIEERFASYDRALLDAVAHQLLSARNEPAPERFLRRPRRARRLSELSLATG